MAIQRKLQVLLVLVGAFVSGAASAQEKPVVGLIPKGHKPVYSGPAAVGSPSAFGRVQLVDKAEPDALKPLGMALLPLALTKSANYGWLYGTVCVSPTIEKSVAKLEGKVIDGDGKVRKTSAGSRKTLDGGFVMWNGSWELFDLPPGVYTLELTAFDKEGKAVTTRMEKLLHGNPILVK